MLLYITIIQNTVRQYVIKKFVRYTSQARNALNGIWKNQKHK